MPWIKLRELLENKGVKAGIINASGDLTTWGKQRKWKVLEYWDY